jgi:hypothetical protein
MRSLKGHQPEVLRPGTVSDHLYCKRINLRSALLVRRTPAVRSQKSPTHLHRWDGHVFVRSTPVSQVSVLTVLPPFWYGWQWRAT